MKLTAKLFKKDFVRTARAKNLLKQELQKLIGKENLLLVDFDLDHDADYDKTLKDLNEAIGEASIWSAWHCLGSTWILKTIMTTEVVYGMLVSHIRSDKDHLLVVQITDGADINLLTEEKEF